MPIRSTGVEVHTVAEARGMVRYENPSTGQPVDGFGVPEVDDDDVLAVQGLAARVPGRRR